MRVLVAFLTFLAALPAAAQQGPVQEPVPRQRVRLTLSDGTRVVGTAAAAGRDSLVLRSPSGGTSYAWPDLLRVEVSRGRRNYAAAGAAIGFGAGLVGGLIVGARACEHDEDGEFGCLGPLMMAPVIGVGTGLFFGGAVGGVIQRDRWATVREAPGR